MKTIEFTKMVASGNDFAVINNVNGNYHPFCSSLPDLARRICDRKYGAGADGMLLLEKSDKARTIRMRIFNPDGSEAEMCGNGTRCCAKYFSHQLIKIETKAGMLEATVNGDLVKLKMFEPHTIKLNFKLIAHSSQLIANYIDTGVPHVVIFVDDLKKIDIATLGRAIRYHKDFAPKGTNVDFVKVLDRNSIAIRTYERGVEAETLACGTGAVAAAILSNLGLKVNVVTQGGETLKVYFDRDNDKITNVWLEGNAKIVYTGRFNYGP